jgi:ParB family chromosome partitioning protein
VDEIMVGNRHRKHMGDMEALKESIERLGVLLQPIVVTPEKKLIAGYRRLEAVKALNWKKVPCFITTISDILQAEHDENAIREQFTNEEIAGLLAELEEQRKARVERVANRREAGESQRTIAKAEGISQVQVRRDLKDAQLSRGGSTESSNGTVKGTDGKTYPKNKPAKDIIPEDAGDAFEGLTPAEEAKVKEADRAAKVVRDHLGNEVPKRLRDLFAEDFVGQAVRQVKQISSTIRGDSQAYAYLHSKVVFDQCEGLVGLLESGRPWVVCDQCQGKGCKHCRTAGYLGRGAYEERSVYAS